MAENTHISWADHTFNPWIGCTKVSPACDGCYAAELMGTAGGRFKRVTWGEPGKGEGTRDRTKDWSKPRKWNRQAAGAPGQTFVFCASLADVFDNAVPPEWRRDLFKLIEETPNLTWLLLTKRPGMIVKLFTEAIGLTTVRDKAMGAIVLSSWPSNAAIGCTVISQEEADRDVPKLLQAKAALQPAFAFLSMEPLLGPVDLTGIDDGAAHREVPRDEWGGLDTQDSPPGLWWNVLTGRREIMHGGATGDWSRYDASLDWVITGGETDQGAHKARPADPAWYRSLRDQCAAAGVPFHFKQWGEWQPFMAQVGPEVRPPESAVFDDRPGARPVWRFGKEVDPCTLDGVAHLARPAVTR